MSLVHPGAPEPSPSQRSSPWARSAPSGLLDPVAAQVETTLFRALAALRLLVAAYAVVLNAVRWREFEHPVAGWVVVAVIVGWTLVASWAYEAPSRRVVPLLVVDFVVSAATLLSTPYVQSNAMIERHASTMPSFWVMVAVLAWSVSHGWRGGLVAAVLMSLLDLSVHTDRTGTTWGNIFLLLLAAGVVGYSSALVREASEARAEAERVAAVLAERARLARAVHDGVLQVLALVQRQGRHLGGEAADLGRLAGEQEVALRALVQGTVREPPVAGAVDLVEALSRLESRTVTLSGPAGTLPMPGPVVDELTRVVRACLDNVTRHVGEDALVWLLIERVAGEVVVTVRDEGPGIAPGRLAQARTQGRLGVAESIEGRMRDLGGTARLLTGEGEGEGTEWELVVPSDAGS